MMLKAVRIPLIASLALLVYMPFHIFLAQSLSLATGGLDLWKIGKDLMLILAVLFTICLVVIKGKANRTFTVVVGGTALYGLFHLGLWALHPDLYNQSAALGTIYNTRLLLFAVLGFGAVTLLPKFVFSSLLKIVLIVSTIVAALGILQYFLPNDVLSHVGYSLERGVRPAFSIDDNPDFPRIMSTLREPNALGAYLIVPLVALTVLFFRVKDGGRRFMLAGAFGLHGLALVLTFSRSAWLAAALAVLLALWWQNQEWVAHMVKRFWPISAAAILVIATAGFFVKDTHLYQQYIVHSNSQETVDDLDSNDYHALLIEQGLRGVADEPLGHGPGTAGIVSIQNPGGGQLTENYYIQIAYEVGIAGAALFIALNLWIYVRIWRGRTMLAIILCASFWGYVVTNMLLHTWSNEAVAAQWWILAGMALAASQAPPKRAKST